MQRGRAARLRDGMAFALMLVLMLAPWCAARASALGYCNPPAPMSAAQRDHLLRFAAVIKDTLEDSGADIAVVSRSGLDLNRFGYRYSHAGLGLRDSPGAPWSVRQLYYACAEGRPRLFDQGMSAFVMGADDPALGYVSIVVLPPEQAGVVERAALDKPLALSLLGERYSANAYPFSVRYQNCNQWVMELLALAWRGTDSAGQVESAEGAEGSEPSDGAREHAQAWLRAHAYQPAVFQVRWRPLLWLAGLVRWVHSDDHPPDDLDRDRYQVSMPASIEAFIEARVPGAERVEICQTEHRIVVHRGWGPVAAGCLPGEGDTVIGLD